MAKGNKWRGTQNTSTISRSNTLSSLWRKRRPLPRANPRSSTTARPRIIHRVRITCFRAPQTPLLSFSLLPRCSIYSSPSYRLSLVLLPFNSNHGATNTPTTPKHPKTCNQTHTNMACQPATKCRTSWRRRTKSWTTVRTRTSCFGTRTRTASASRTRTPSQRTSCQSISNTIISRLSCANWTCTISTSREMLKTRNVSITHSLRRTRSICCVKLGGRRRHKYVEETKLRLLATVLISNRPVELLLGLPIKCQWRVQVAARV